MGVEMSAFGKLILLAIFAVLAVGLFRALFMFKPLPAPTSCIDSPNHHRLSLKADPHILQRFIGGLNIPTISYKAHEYDGPQMQRMIEYIRESEFRT